MGTGPRSRPGRREEGTSRAWERVAGRAEAFAATLGVGQARPVDLLFALLWDGWAWHYVYLNHGSRPEAVLEFVANEVPVPDGALPEPDPAIRIRGSQRVTCPRRIVSEVLTTLNDRKLGAGVAYGFTLPEDDFAWLVGSQDVPLQEIIDEVVGRRTHHSSGTNENTPES